MVNVLKKSAHQEIGIFAGIDPRLLGGIPKSDERKPEGGLAVRALFPSRSEYSSPDVLNDYIRERRVEPQQLKPGDRVSFVYFRATRSGQRRTCKLQKVLANNLMEMHHEDIVDVRKCWPNHTAKAEYFGPERHGEDLSVPSRFKA